MTNERFEPVTELPDPAELLVRISDCRLENGADWTQELQSRKIRNPQSEICNRIFSFSKRSCYLPSGCRRDRASLCRAQLENRLMPKDTLTITDNRTGKSFEIPIQDGTIRAMDLRQIKTSLNDFGLMTYDPAFTNTASCRSKITFIDGDRGILEYRGYPIEELAEKSTYLETAYLILHGELPDQARLAEWVHNIKNHTLIHENIKKLIDGFHHDAHPMGMLLSIVGALSTFYPDAKNIFDSQIRREQTFRLIAKMPTIAAFCYRHSVGLPYAYPDNDLSYTGNFLNMLFKMTELKYKPHPVLERALEVLFILHADHEQNCSTNAMRSVGSSHVDPYAAIAAATAALYGPLHGGANEAVLRMLNQVGSRKNVPEFIQKVKRGEGRLMGFGHRIYKSYDPRAKIIKQVADKVFEVMGANPLLEVALELERIALEDEYFVSRKLYPNVDFYSGLIYQSMRLPVDMFPVMFAIPRTCGWIAQWEEMILDSEQKIARPRQIYQGPSQRRYHD
jgi:citrate synthase